MNDRLTEKIRKRYNRNAFFFDSMDRMIRDEWRQEVIGKAAGDVLEVGVGTGKNLSFYNRQICRRVTGIDFSPGMLSKAYSKMAKAPVPVELIEMDAQQMAFPDHTFDTVVSTCVFCSIPDPMAGLQEVRRVCKPEGKIYFIEHMRLDWPVIGTAMDLFNPISVGLMGVNINRRTLENIEKSGIKIREVINKVGPLVRFIKASP